MTSSTTPGGLARFNALEEHRGHAALREACASTAWVRTLLAHRPYTTPDDLFAASDAAMAELTAEDLAEAMAGHPPIGWPRPGDPPPPGAARHDRCLRGAQGGDARIEPGVPGEVRPCLPDLAHRPDRRADARRGQGTDRQLARAGSARSSAPNWAKINRIRLACLVEEENE